MRRLTVLLLAATLAAPAAETPIPGTTLRLPAPAGWSVTSDPGAALVLASPDRRLRLAVTLHPLGEVGEAAFAQRCLEDLQRLLPGLVLESWTFAEAHAGRTWSRLRYRFRLGETTVHQALWITAVDRQGICITLGGTDPAQVAPQADRLEADLWGSRPVLR